MLSGFLEVLLAYRKSRESFDPGQAGLGRDRRVFYRVPAQMSSALANPVFGLEASGKTVDLSLGGVGVTAPVNWSEGNRIRVRLSAIPIDVAGIIVFRKEEAPLFRYGVRFQKIGIFQILKLRRFLKQQYNGRLSL